jgi:hypothetical protein
MTKKLIAQMGSNNTVKIFDASTGQLHKIINVDGEITAPPICLESEMYVTVKKAGGNSIYYYNLPTGTLKRVQAV